MEWSWWEKLVGGLVLLFVGTCLVILFVYVPIEMQVEARCLEKGWPEGALTWNLKAYCGREVERTYYVVPLAEAEAGAEPWAAERQKQ